MNWRLGLSGPIFSLFLLFPPAIGESAECAQPKPVCDTRTAVFAVSAFDPMASATRIGKRLLVTSRHVVADQTDVTVHLPGNQTTTARVIPTGYRGDLVLIESKHLPEGPILSVSKTAVGDQVFSVGVDIRQHKVRAYPPGPVQFLPDELHPLARLHHQAFSEPGNSGGAMVDRAGKLVGIIASGGEGRSEAVPATEITRLRALSGAGFKQINGETGVAVRVCTLKIEELQSLRPRSIDDQEAMAVSTACRRSFNRQLLELAGQVLGRFGWFDESVALLKTALSEDPNAINSRVSLIVTQSIAGRYEASIEHIRWLLDHKVEDLQILRFGIQSGIWGGDRKLAERALARLKDLNPQMALSAERFLAAPPSRPKRR